MNFYSDSPSFYVVLCLLKIASSIYNMTSERKMTVNDPIYGMIYLPYPLLSDLIDHPYFQRLRNIQQSGLASFVFPGATHTRFAHSIGATHLMNRAIMALRQKNIDITETERQAALIAILLHDVGHGPFSHALEYSLVGGISHEDISAIVAKKLNETFDGKLNLSQDIFAFNYPKRFLSQMVSSQLDMDRLDYLQRDSFYSGVDEASIGAIRLIDSLDVQNQTLCLDEKAIYSLEQFLLARKIMYLQVYLHKTVIGVEGLLVRILKRAKFLAQKGEVLFASPALQFFLKEQVTLRDFQTEQKILVDFLSLDDAQIWSAIRVWTTHSDFILSDLSARLMDRKLHKIEVSAEPFALSYLEEVRNKVQKKFKLAPEEVDYYCLERAENFEVYNPKEGLYILQKDGKMTELYQKGKAMGLSITEKTVSKYFLGYPRDIK